MISNSGLKQRITNEARAILMLGGPLVVNNIFTIAMQAADTIMAGRLSATDLAAIAIGTSIWTPLFLFGLGILMALSPVVAEHFGGARHSTIGFMARQGIWLSLVIAGIIMGLLYSVGWIFPLIGLEAKVIVLAQGYLDAMLWGLPGIYVFQVLRFTSEGVARTKPIMYISIAALPVNILGNYIFMYGKLGFPAFGAIGCGWASAVTMWLMLATMTIHMKRSAVYEKLEIFHRFERVNLRAAAVIAGLGMPIGISLFVETSMFAAVAMLMGSLGSTIVAAHQIAINYAAIAWMVPLGLSMALTVRVGQAMGRGDVAQAKTSGITGMGLCVVIMCISAFVIFSIPDVIVGFYSKDLPVRQTAEGLLLMAAFFQISDGLQVASAGALRGLKDTRIPMIITMLAYWACGFPIAYLLGIHYQLGPRSIWVGLIAGLTIAAILLSLRFFRVIERNMPDAN